MPNAFFSIIHLVEHRRVIQTKDKRKQTVDEEITTNVFVWNTNEYQQMDENDNRLLSQLEQPDPCMRTLDEITLHDVDENENGFVEREHNVRRNYTNRVFGGN